MTQYLLVRHGTTDWVDTQLLHGITDIPLNERGRKQAQAAAKALASSGAKKIYSSPLSRCAETAHIISKTTDLEPIMKDGLVEIDFGWLEGKKIRDHDNGEYRKLVEFIDHHFFNFVRAISGESHGKFSRRVVACWDSITEANHDGTIIIVIHSGVINTILLHLFGTQYLNGNAYHHLNPCSITRIKINPNGKAELIALNERTHIPEDLQ